MEDRISLLLWTAVAIVIIYYCFQLIKFTQRNVYVKWERREMK
jgi:hypothetical protein